VTGPDRLRVGDKDDGDRRCRRLCGPGEERAPRHDQVHLAPNQVRREIWEPSGVALGRSDLDQNVLALDPAALLQAQPEGLQLTAFRRVRGGFVRQDTDAVHLPRLLGLGGERRHEQGEEQEKDHGAIIGEVLGRGKCAWLDIGSAQAWRRCYDGSVAMPFIPPMLASRLEDPRRLADPRYSAEPKLDGQRAQLHVRGHRTVLAFSRPGRELIRLPGLAWLLEIRWPVASAVLDGEAVAGDGSEGIQAVFEARHRPGSPMAFAAFDLLELDGQRPGGALDGPPEAARGICSRCPRLASASCR